MHRSPAMRVLVALDLESVLVPEIWRAVARHSGVEALAATTREVADYRQLMHQRIRLCRKHGLTLKRLRAIVAELRPLPGASAFFDWARARFCVIVLSDTFYELAQPLTERLGRPLLLCHHLDVDADGFVCGIRLWQADGKRAAVRACRHLGYRVLAVGDSYNDLSMLGEADQGLLFCAPERLAARHAEYPHLQRYDQLQAHLLRHAAGDHRRAELTQR